MIPFKNRFHGYGSMKYTYQKGQMIRSKNFSIKFSPNPRRRFSRIGIVVSKKVDKRAVVRNKIRRRFYNIIHQYIKDFNQSYDFILMIYSKEVLEIDYQHLDQKIKQLLIDHKII